MTYYPAVGFHFQVTFEGLPNTTSQDVSFQSVAGLDVQLDTETWKEGGQNHFTHALPGRSKFSSSLTLKRGLLRPKQSGITDWCLKAFQDLKITPLQVVTVALLDEEHNVLVKWDLEHVWPKSWKIGELNAERSEVLIETLELSYNRFTYKTP
ncbi:MAG TPA: phage tail protein [Nitrospira sp.]|nr:phage tail protein [Nitrospira sp.]